MKKKTTEEQLAFSGTEEGQILARLSERVDRAVQMIQDLRKERDQLKAQLEKVDEASSRIVTLEGERSEIRNRIEGILESLEALESE